MGPAGEYNGSTSLEVLAFVRLLEVPVVVRLLHMTEVLKCAVFIASREEMHTKPGWIHIAPW